MIEFNASFIIYKKELKNLQGSICKKSFIEYQVTHAILYTSNTGSSVWVI